MVKLALNPMARASIPSIAEPTSQESKVTDRIPVKIRTLAPQFVQKIGRKTSVRLAQPTSRWRIQPQFILAGGQRCGTTSLFRALEQHPETVRPTFHKGINYFDLNYYRGPQWYAGHFPLLANARRRAPEGCEPIAFEASGYYMFHPEAMPRIAHDLPEVKIVVMLRDPIERAYSAWKHESARGFETEEFVRALHLEDERLEGEAVRLRNPRYESYAHRHHAYAARSDYATQLNRLLHHIPLNRLHVIYSETFFHEPAAEFGRLTDFLGARPPQNLTYDQHNARPSGSMPAAARTLLRARLERTYEDLERLTGRRPPWRA